MIEIVVASYWGIASRVVGMASGNPEDRARRLERERQRRRPAQHAQTEEPRSDSARADTGGHQRRAAATVCGWCGGPLTPGRRGPIPKWCSTTCRHRSWEQATAAASGLSAVKVVERRVEVQVPLAPTRRDWAKLLGELVGQLNDGRVYDRDLPALGRVLQPVLENYRRRAHLSGTPDLH